tara:strand:+ start:251 stop:385 length:135 start_codon:yes stop_codon:yes gene_type:complete
LLVVEVAAAVPCKTPAVLRVGLAVVVALAVVWVVVQEQSIIMLT